METDKKTNRSKLLYGAVIAVLIVFFIVGFAYGLNSVLIMEGSFPPVVLTQGKTPEPKTPQEALAYLNRAVSEAQAAKPKFASDAWFSIDADSITATGEDAIKDTLLYVHDNFTDHLNESLEKQETDFSEDFSALLRVPELNASDIESFTCEYIYYKCASCGETSGEPQTSCEYCGSELPYEMQYRDDYTITYHLVVSDQVLHNNYNIRTEDEIIAMLGDQYKDLLSLDSVEISCSSLTIRMQINRASDEIQSLVFEQKMPVRAVGNWKELPEGAFEITADITETHRYTFTWPNLSLSAHSMDLEPKGTDHLLATLTFSSPSQENVVWTSSDESIVTVDDEGYLKASKKTGTATISAAYEFNGKTYTDTCDVNVKYDVESLSLNKRKVSLNVGNTFSLTAKVSPKKATIQTVTWYSEDESVAVVDENGNVTAVSPGTVVIYALSDDLYFKSSCEVTVK